MLYEIPDIRNNQSGYDKISNLNKTTASLFADELELSFAHCAFFEANMSAPLAVVLSNVYFNLNDVKITNIPDKIRKILCSNSFLESYGYECLPDTKGTTIPFQRMKLSDGGLFEEYLKRYYRERGLPSMTPQLLNKLRMSIFEIYQNAVMHSEARIGMYVCGQLYPQNHRLDFTLADAGVGIRTKVRKYFNREDISSVTAIHWALQEGKTTKTGSQPGGMGLKFLKEFVSLNKGKLQIASRYGFYEYSAGTETFAKLSGDFPGTVVNLEVNTADQQSYRLSSEISPNDIF